MVVNVDDWVETNQGEIVLVVSIPARAIPRTLEVYDPVTRTARHIAVDDVKRGFNEVPHV